MSKELEAIFEIERKLNTATFRIDAEYIEEELELLKKTLTAPTADEVCKALIEYFKKSKYHSYIDTVYYSEDGKYFYTEDENRNLIELIFDNYYIHEISPHLITMIGRFYEGLEK